MMYLACDQLFLALWTLPFMMMVMIGETEMLHLNVVSMSDMRRNNTNTSAPGAPREHKLSKDMREILDFHNDVRSRVSPRAANMEYMAFLGDLHKKGNISPLLGKVWDEALATFAQSWASRCKWARGPPEVLVSNGQSLSLFSGRSVTNVLKSWYNERLNFSFPNTCNASTCEHYIQMVWATSNKIGCAVHTCSNMDASGMKWKWASLLVCNYATGNWVGDAPYKTGKPCSVCPSSSTRSCENNMCYSKPKPK